MGIVTKHGILAGNNNKISPFNVNKELKLLSTDYELQVAGHTLTLGDSKKLTIGREDLVVTTGGKKYVALLQEVGENSEVRKMVFSPKVIDQVNTDDSEAIGDSTSNLKIDFTAPVETTALVTALVVKPSESGRMEIVVHKGTQPSGEILYKHRMHIADDMVGNEVRFDTSYLVYADEDVYIQFNGVMPLGIDSKPYLTIESLPVTFEVMLVFTEADKEELNDLKTVSKVVTETKESAIEAGGDSDSITINVPEAATITNYQLLAKVDDILYPPNSVTAEYNYTCQFQLVDTAVVAHIYAGPDATGLADGDFIFNVTYTPASE